MSCPDCGASKHALPHCPSPSCPWKECRAMVKDDAGTYVPCRTVFDHNGHTLYEKRAS